MKRRIALWMAVVMLFCAAVPQGVLAGEYAGGRNAVGSSLEMDPGGESAGDGLGRMDVQFGKDFYVLDPVAARGGVSFTEDQLLRFLKKYDRDGHYILDKQRRRGGRILSWFSPGSKMVSEGLEVAVHEETHGYSFQDYPWWSGAQGESIYTGNQKKIDVRYTKVYRSREMARTIPASLRTERYDLYVGNPTANLASDVNGAYGLLNEFTAYYWGMHTIMSLKPYFEKNARKPSDWNVYLHSGSNDRMAYAEFRFYILEYLYYAKKHYPQIYNGIMNNKNFVKAFQTIDKKFIRQNKAYERQLKRLVKYYNKKGIWSEIRGDFIFLGGSGVGIRTSSYNKLMKEMKKKKYQPILKILKG
ncbi:MAG: hypothetical protein Q4D55_04360 [Eubacteriales bacterium]|nr:hypothetical protein [Eubacteriales bacterium]